MNKTCFVIMGYGIKNNLNLDLNNSTIKSNDKHLNINSGANKIEIKKKWEKQTPPQKAMLTPPINILYPISK